MNEYRNFFEGFNEAGEAITGMTSLHAAPEDFQNSCWQSDVDAGFGMNNVLNARQAHCESVHVTGAPLVETRV